MRARGIGIRSGSVIWTLAVRALTHTVTPPWETGLATDLVLVQVIVPDTCLGYLTDFIFPCLDRVRPSQRDGRSFV